MQLHNTATSLSDNHYRLILYDVRRYLLQVPLIPINYLAYFFLDMLIVAGYSPIYSFDSFTLWF